MIMKKILALILSVLTLCLCASCGGTNGGDKEPPKEDENRLLTVEEIMESYSAGKLKCDKYSLAKYTSPYWTNQVIYNETVCFYAENGAVQEKKLMYKPAKILEVRSYGLDKLYEEGSDYVMTAEGIKLSENSTIPHTDFDFFYLDEPLDPNAAFRSISHPDKFVAYNEFQRFTDKQVCVTYIRTEEYKGPAQEYSQKLDKFVQKLENRENVTLLFYGDSIMEGCNASGYRNYAPKMPKFSDLVSKQLSNVYGYNGDTEITTYNTAVGGWLSSTGIERWTAKNKGIKPDLFVVNFGCNDGTFSASPDSVVNNLRSMIKRAKTENPDCAVIILSPIIPNTDATTSVSEPVVRNFANNQEEYESYFCDLADEYEDAVCIKITEFYKWILERKEFIDVMASNISHPNDFFVRVYAQSILSKLIKNYK